MKVWLHMAKLNEENLEVNVGYESSGLCLLIHLLILSSLVL